MVISCHEQKLLTAESIPVSNIGFCLPILQALNLKIYLHETKLKKISLWSYIPNPDQ